MLQFIIKRLLQTIALLIGISLITYVLMQMTPGGPLAMEADTSAMGRVTPEQLEQLRARYGLDQPIHIRYLRWAVDIAKGDFGNSFITGRAVITMIVERLPNTLLLTGTSFILTVLIAFPIGVLAAVRQYSFFDYLTTTFAFLGISIPRFWLAIMLLYVFTFSLGWLPSVGLSDPRFDYTGWDAVVDRLRHMIMPVICLTVVSVAGLTRYVRAAMLEVINQDYVRTARSKGLSERVVIFFHALRNGSIPVITILVLEIPDLFLSSVVVETIFAIPGMGRLFIQSAHYLDYPVLMGILMIGSMLIIFANLLADVLYGVLDPRIRYE